MGKRKQSKVSWSKRGQPLADAAQEVRRRANQDRRTGGVSGLRDSDLFAVDATAATAKPVGLGHRRKPKPERQLHVDKVIAVNPHIPTVMKPETASSKAGALNHGGVLMRQKLGKVNKAAARTLAHKAARAAALGARGPAPAPVDSLDIWSDASTSAPKRARVASHRAPEPSRVAAAVPVPAEGASWNPDFEAHQALLAEATDHVLHQMQKDKVHRLPTLFRPAPWEEDEEDQTQLLTAEDYREDESADEESDDEEAGEAGEAVGAKRKREPLTRTQRNKQARAKALEQERAAKAAEKKRERQLGRVGALEAEIKREERARAARQAEEAAREAARVRKLGPRRHVEKRPDVLLSDEQPTALRQMVTEGSLLDDRFESMQARNLIEVRDKNTKPSRRHMKKVLREGSKDAKYLSPHGYAGKMPAWL